MVENREPFQEPAAERLRRETGERSLQEYSDLTEAVQRGDTAAVFAWIERQVQQVEQHYRVQRRRDGPLAALVSQSVEPPDPVIHPAAAVPAIQEERGELELEPIRVPEGEAAIQQLEALDPATVPDKSLTGRIQDLQRCAKEFRTALAKFERSEDLSASEFTQAVWRPLTQWKTTPNSFWSSADRANWQAFALCLAAETAMVSALAQVGTIFTPTVGEHPPFDDHRYVSPSENFLLRTADRQVHGEIAAVHSPGLLDRQGNRLGSALVTRFMYDYEVATQFRDELHGDPGFTARHRAELEARLSKPWALESAQAELSTLQTWLETLLTPQTDESDQTRFDRLRSALTTEVLDRYEAALSHPVGLATPSSLEERTAYVTLLRSWAALRERIGRAGIETLNPAKGASVTDAMEVVDTQRTILPAMDGQVATVRQPGMELTIGQRRTTLRTARVIAWKLME